MQQGLFRCNPLTGIPLYAPPHKIHKQLILAPLQHFLKSSPLRHPKPVCRLHNPTLEAIRKEPLPPEPSLEHSQRRSPHQLYIHHKLLVLTLARKQWVPGPQLPQHAPKRPHIDRRSVPDAQDHLGCPVEPALNVGVELFVLVAAAAQVDQSQARLVGLLQHHVFGLDIAVDYLPAVQKVQGVEDLDCEFY